MKTIYACIICGLVYGCDIDGKVRNCHTDCNHSCMEGDLCTLENSVCKDCLQSEDWEI